MEQETLDKLILSDQALSWNNHNGTVHLTTTEAEIMQLLLTSENIILSTDDISKLIYSDEDYMTSENIYVHIANVRKKMKQIWNKNFIKTYRYRGYGIKYI